MKLTDTTKNTQQTIQNITDTLLKDEAIGGKLLLIAAALALIIVNSPLLPGYDSFWSTKLTIGVGSFAISESLLHWVNDGLMALFFLMVGLEINHEFRKGELRKFKVAILPIGAAIGGMIIPALIYLSFNAGGAGAKGWGIPVATDIAFAIGVLVLLGSRIPSSLKLFLLTLAIVDDLIAIVIIALFYTSTISSPALLAASAIFIGLLLVRKYQSQNMLLFIALGICLWIAVQASGVHATIAGALLGFLAPLSSAGNKESISDRLERIIIPLSTFVVIPLFAFANAGVVISLNAFNSEVTKPVVWGVIFGLIAGKAIGVAGTVWILTKLRIAVLPKQTNWLHILGVGLLAGIGFTVSIFITELAFESDNQLIAAAKMGIIVASLIAAVGGSAMLWLASKRSSYKAN